MQSQVEQQTNGQAPLDRLSSSFGQESVAPEERGARIHTLFQSIAGRYDLMNDLMSGGMHRLWKRQFVAQVSPSLDGPIYDVAGGTGDIAALLAKKFSDRPLCLLDPSSNMLSVARERLGDRCEYIVAPCEDWPVDDGQVAAATLSFGLRNFSRPSVAFGEILRVLRPNGELHILEFSQPDAWLAPIYRLYARLVIPTIGALVTGNRGAYRYLIDSISTFPSVEEVSTSLEMSGFEIVRTKKILFGIAAIHVAKKPDN